MFKTITFTDKIIVYMCKPDNVGEFTVMLNGKALETVNKSYYIFSGLSEATSYNVSIVRGEKVLFNETLTTCQKDIIDVSKPPYSAPSDGVTYATTALQAALDNATENSVVLFPKGIYLTGGLNVHGGTEIYLEKGAVILGSPYVEDYLPGVLSRFEGYEINACRSLINIGELDHNKGYTTKNVIIRGEGEIRGGGKTLAESAIVYEKEKYPDRNIWGRIRPRLINVYNSENVFFDGLTFSSPSSWMVHMVYSKNVVTSNCNFYSFGIHNGDGWDPDSSEDCSIFGCFFDVGDDCVAVKSGKNPEGNVIARPSKNICVSDCLAKRGHGFAIGSEISGGIENVYVWNCDFQTTLYGLHIKTTKKRGGYIKNVTVRDSIFSNINVETIWYNDDGESADTLTVMENIFLKNIRIWGRRYLDEVRNEVCNGIVIDDRDFILKNLKLSNVTITESGKTDIESALNRESVKADSVVCLDRK